MRNKEKKNIKLRVRKFKHRVIIVGDTIHYIYSHNGELLTISYKDVKIYYNTKTKKIRIYIKGECDKFFNAGFIVNTNVLIDLNVNDVNALVNYIYLVVFTYTINKLEVFYTFLNNCGDDIEVIKELRYCTNVIYNMDSEMYFENIKCENDLTEELGLNTLIHLLSKNFTALNVVIPNDDIKNLMSTSYLGTWLSEFT